MVVSRFVVLARVVVVCGMVFVLLLVDVMCVRVLVLPGVVHLVCGRDLVLVGVHVVCCQGSFPCQGCFSN
jgi:hypothetical protein